MRNPSGRPEHYLQGRGVHHALTALQSEGSSTWHRPLLEGPVICSGLDEGMNNTRHLGSDDDRLLHRLQRGDQLVVIGSGVQDRHAAPASSANSFDQDLIAVL